MSPIPNEAQLSLAIFLVIVAACNREPSPAAGANPSEIPGATGQEKQKRTPVKAQLGESAARDKAARLAGAKFLVTKLTDAAGKTIAPPSPSASEFRARVETARWHLSFGGPAGAWAEVSFDLNGAGESVEVGFAAD
jgi:hypothetical protein